MKIIFNFFQKKKQKIILNFFFRKKNSRFFFKKIFNCLKNTKPQFLAISGPIGVANFCLKSGDFFQELIFGGAEVAILNENVAIFRIFHLATLKKTKLRREQAQNRYDIFKNRFGIKRKLVSHPFFVIIACACKKSQT